MKTILRYILILLLIMLPVAEAQIEVRIQPDRRNYLRGEQILMNLYLRNNTDQTVVLSNKPGRPWLHINARSKSYPTGVPRAILAKFPTVTISSGSTVAYKLDLSPAFRFDKSDIYTVSATIRMPDGGSTYSTPITTFNLNEGFSFKKFNLSNRGRSIELHAKTMNVHNSPALFGQAIDKNSRIVISSSFLGKYLSYMKPIFLLDGKQHMHVFFQSTPKYYIYAVVAPNGKKTVHEVYRRTRGPLDLIAIQGKIRVLGAAPYKALPADTNKIRSASDRPL